MRLHRSALILASVGASLAVGANSLDAQMRRPRAELTPIVETSPARAGAQAQLSLKVKLPAEVHVQSDKPRDPALIPTVLTVTPPDGVTVEQIIYPPATDLAQTGASKPLAVFGSEFTIGVRIAVASSVATGDVIVPVQLRYQACDASVCYPPTKDAAQFTVHVKRGGAAR